MATQNEVNRAAFEISRDINRALINLVKAVQTLSEVTTTLTTTVVDLDERVTKLEAQLNVRNL